MFCVRCGARNPEEAGFCFRCGAPIEASAPPSENAAATLNEPAGPYQPPVSASPSPYQPQSYNYYPAAPPAVPAPPQLLQYHPLALGAFNLPYDLLQAPQQFYSYLNPQGQVVFARRARFGTRVGAALLDLLILSLPYFVLIGIIGAASLEPGGDPLAGNRRVNPEQTGWLLLFSYSLLFGYFYFTGIKFGQSLGKRITHIKVIRLDGRKPDRLTALLRFLPGYTLSANILPVSLIALVAGAFSNPTTGLIIGLAAFGWGFWWSALGPLHLAWHDKLARTLVVDTREYVQGAHFFRAAGVRPEAGVEQQPGI